MKLIFATNNAHKLEEVKTLLFPFEIRILSLKDKGINTEIPEDYETLEENAIQKARFIYEKTGENTLADDTGLEVAALNGAPGVYSARYAGTNGNAEANIQKLLSEMEGIPDRSARFRTVIALILNGKEYTFEGTVKGHITAFPKGSQGFGYDPVFIPEGYTQTFAEMPLSEKNNISHRANALRKLVRLFENQC